METVDGFDELVLGPLLPRAKNDGEEMAAFALFRLPINQ